MLEPHVIRFNLATTGLTSHAHPLTVRVDLTKNVEVDKLRGQGERLAEHLAAALPAPPLSAKVDAVYQKEQS